MKILTNFLYLSGAETASKVMTFIVITYLARVAGPVGYGYVEFAGAVLLCAGLIVDQGFGLLGAREIAKNPVRTAALVSEIVIARLFLAIVAYVAMIGFALLLNRESIVTRLIVIYGLGLLVSPLLLQWVFQGHNRMRPVAAMQCIRQAVLAVVVLAFVRDPSQIWLAAVGDVVGACVTATFGLWVYLAKFDGRHFIRPTVSWYLFREGIPIGLSQMFWMVRMFGATVLVGIIATAQDLGYFGSAMRILIALHTFVWLYYFNLLPSLSKAWHRKDGTFAQVIARSLHLIAWITLISGLVWVLVAPIVTKLVYGPAFAPAGVTLQWLAGVGVAAGLSGHYRFGLIAAGRQNVEMLIGAIAAVAALVVIPIGYSTAGPSGVAIGLLGTEVLVWILAWSWSKRYLGLNGHLQYLIRPVAVAGFTAILSWVLPLGPPSIRAATAGLVFVVLAYAADEVLRRRCFELIGWGRPLLRRRGLKRIEVA